jgi:hypothetical protein
VGIARGRLTDDFRQYEPRLGTDQPDLTFSKKHCRVHVARAALLDRTRASPCANSNAARSGRVPFPG